MTDTDKKIDTDNIVEAEKAADTDSDVEAAEVAEPAEGTDVEAAEAAEPAEETDVDEAAEAAEPAEETDVDEAAEAAEPAEETDVDEAAEAAEPAEETDVEAAGVAEPSEETDVDEAAEATESDEDSESDEATEEKPDTEEKSEADKKQEAAGNDNTAEDFYDDSDETAARWYVIHTYSGHENKVKSSIEKLVENYGDEVIFRQTLPDGSERDYTMTDLVLKIQVPVHDVAVLKDGQHKIKSRKMFPGYVLVKMIVSDKSWYLVRNTQGVTGFVGYTTATHKNRPVPLSKEEVRRMGIEKVNIELDINVGDSIKVINGPFESFTGIVEEVNPEKETLKARISMFGRDTPVELIYDQVDKVY